MKQHREEGRLGSSSRCTHTGGTTGLLPDVVLIRSGVQPGEQIVVTNLEQIADGSRVLLVVDDR